MTEIVIHTVVALQCVGEASLAQPLYALLTDPSSMNVSIHRYVILRKSEIFLSIGQNDNDNDNIKDLLLKW